MAAKVCVVSFLDLEGIRDSVEVAAETLYEAAALAVSEIRRQELIEDDIAPGSHTCLQVLVKSPTTCHEVSLKQLRAWLERSGKSPREVILNRRIRSLL